MPEDRYGKVKLGQTVTVAIDSFPGQTFHAAVVSISSQPVFLPRTTTTVPGSQSTVYAIQVKLSDGAGKLKPGMPADVAFILN